MRFGGTSSPFLVVHFSTPGFLNSGVVDVCEAARGCLAMALSLWSMKSNSYLIAAPDGTFNIWCGDLIGFYRTLAAAMRSGSAKSHIFSYEMISAKWSYATGDRSRV
jgi:hypothetical protein